MAETKGRSPGSRHAQPSRRLAAIMFTDLVGYSALAHRDEELAIELLELHRGWVREILPRHGGIEIETVGDAFLIEFAGALAAVECAVAIQHRFAEHNAAAPPDRRMELRIGIHLGDIEHKGHKVFGDGVNIASRIHGMARPGGICVSEAVHYAVRNRPAFQFASLGSPPLKNITTALELFELAPSLSFAPPAGAEAAVARPPPATAKTRRWLPAVAVAGGVAVVLAAVGGWLATRAPTSTVPAIAVLPFENLSADPDSAFFTDGLHDTVIGHLSRVAGLKVISRTSVMGYRGQKSKLKQIARELGVTSVVEGSVQRVGSKLRVAAQLIDTASDTHLWSNEYNREMADVFEVQADIAQQVAKAVQVRLTPQEQASIQAVPTRNQAAYELYLRALVIQRSAGDVAKAGQALGWLSEAIALDPGFAQAYALTAELHDFMHWFGYDNSDARRQLVSVNAAKALSLDPKSVEAHIAKALDDYHGSRNYDAAIRELEIARGLAPNDASVHFWLGVIYRRQGRWDDALATLEKVTVLDPLNVANLLEYAWTLQGARRYGAATPVFERIAHVGNEPSMPTQIAYNAFLQSGQLAGVDAALAGLPANYDPGCQVTWYRYFLALYQRRYADAAAAASACKEASFPADGSEVLPKEYPGLRAQWFAGNRRNLPQAGPLRQRFERALEAKPDQPYTRMFLAFTLVMLGEPARALEEADRALAAMPLSRDALSGAFILLWAAEVQANAGATDRALGTLAQALSVPYGGGVEEIRLDPVWDPLRKDPRFERLLDEHRPGKV